MDFFIGLMIGIFVGVLAGIFITALMSANGRSEPEPDGVDEALDEVEKYIDKKKNDDDFEHLLFTLKNQGTPTCLINEDRRQELLERYKE